jgi:hypothetical protein
MRRQNRREPSGLLVLLTVLCSLTARQAQANRVPCTEVVSAIDAVTSRRGSDRADPIRLANRLGVEPAWVTYCAQLYGRRVAKGLPPITEDERDQMQERWESDERDESEVDDRIQGPLEVEEERRGPRIPPPPDPEAERRMLESDNPPPLP